MYTRVHFSVRKACHFLQPATHILACGRRVSLRAHSDSLTIQCVVGLCQFLHLVARLHFRVRQARVTSSTQWLCCRLRIGCHIDSASIWWEMAVLSQIVFVRSTNELHSRKCYRSFSLPPYVKQIRCNNLWETFVDFDICHRMVKWRKLHTMTMTYFLEIQI